MSPGACSMRAGLLVEKNATTPYTNLARIIHELPAAQQELSPEQLYCFDSSELTFDLMVRKTL